MNDSEGAPGPAVREDEWLTTGEAAKILGASLPTVRRMADNGTLVAKRIVAWSSPNGVDRRGHSLRGHRRVSRESVLAMKATRERAVVGGVAVVQNPSPDTLDT